MAPTAPRLPAGAFVPPTPLRRPCTLPSSHRTHVCARLPKRPRPARRPHPASVARLAPTASPAPEPRPEDPVQPPCVIGDYRLQRLVARHAPYLYYDAVKVSENGTDSDAPTLTVKLISLRGLADWRALDSLRREAAVQATVYHPNVPRFVDFVEHETDTNSLHLLVTARPPGIPLYDFVQRFRLTPSDARAVAEQMLCVLADLAELSPPVMHGAVSPYTVYLEPAVSPPPPANEPNESDHYVATVPPPPPPRLSLTGIVSSPTLSPAGPLFVAPERGLGLDDSEGDSDEEEGASDRIDLYAAGATLHFLLTGRAPYDRADTPSFAPGLRAADPCLVAVLTDLLRRDAAKRPSSAACVLARLRSGAADPAGCDDPCADDTDPVPFFMRPDVQPVDRRPSSAPKGAILRTGALLARARGREGGQGRVHVQTGAQGRRLRVAGTPPGFSGGTAGRLAYAAMWTSFTAFWTGGVVASGGLGYIMALFSVPFWRVSAGMVTGLAREVRGGGELRLSAGESERLRTRARRRVGEPVPELEPDAEVRATRSAQVETVRCSATDTATCAGSEGGVATLTVQRVVGRRIELRGALECVGGAGITDVEAGESEGGFAVEILWDGTRVRLVNGVPWSQAKQACEAVNEFLETHAPGRPHRWDGIAAAEAVLAGSREIEAEDEDIWEL